MALRVEVQTQPDDMNSTKDYSKAPQVLKKASGCLKNIVEDKILAKKDISELHTFGRKLLNALVKIFTLGLKNKDAVGKKVLAYLKDEVPPSSPRSMGG